MKTVLGSCHASFLLGLPEDLAGICLLLFGRKNMDKRVRDIPASLWPVVS